MKFTVATFNIHNGFSHLTRRMVIHELKEKLHGLSADVLFLQEVQGAHHRHAGRYQDWPGKPQHEFIADTMWREVAYGKDGITYLSLPDSLELLKVANAPRSVLIGDAPSTASSGLQAVNGWWFNKESGVLLVRHADPRVHVAF
jgi:endonuclease/exonuclease/phosphatase family metal-dependent hydrolase